ncbi:hypothetical protein P5G62_010710 [Neobacillus sp. 179-C4.2 HS]|uniref:Uncharacterized protein n=1 Tax=Neobacillus driksii TaxID=3035913 RepID=A0ABV4YRV3_9BACI|nr:hypothetical protein [Neobacillus sp. 179.-C4.2 HS]MDP5194303.1 hypothetical protein [Neobacillus sp. 179.-C4.2 HS]
MAHYLYHLLDEKKISLDDDVSKIQLVKADIHKVNELVQNNLLGIGEMNIYSLKMNQTDFVFIFAANLKDAIHFYNRTFLRPPLNCHLYSLDVDFYICNDVISFRDSRKEIEQFPAIAGYYTRES